MGLDGSTRFSCFTGSGTALAFLAGDLDLVVRSGVFLGAGFGAGLERAGDLERLGALARAGDLERLLEALVRAGDLERPLDRDLDLLEELPARLFNRRPRKNIKHKVGQ